MRILVIGGTKFFGIPMINTFLNEGHDVTVAIRRHRFRFTDVVWWIDMLDGECISSFKNRAIGKLGVKVLDDIVLKLKWGEYWEYKMIWYSDDFCQVLPS